MALVALQLDLIMDLTVDQLVLMTHSQDQLMITNLDQLTLLHQHNKLHLPQLEAKVQVADQLEVVVGN